MTRPLSEHMAEARKELAHNPLTKDYDAEFVRTLALMNQDRERQAEYRTQRAEALRFTKMVGGFVTDADDDRLAA